MPTASLYATTIPGVTQPASYEGKLPSVYKALGKEKPDERAKALAEISTRWFEAHRWYYREAVETSAHDMGSQWGYYNATDSQWVGTPEAEDDAQIRIVVNLTKPIIDQATSMLTAEKPIFGAGAEQATGSAQAAGEAADEFIKYLWMHHGLDDLYRDVGRSAFATGTSFLLIEWDKSEGPPGPIVDESAPPPALGPAALPFNVGGSSPEGASVDPLMAGPDGMPVPPGPAPVGQIPNPGAPPVAPPIAPPVIGPTGDLRFTKLAREQVAFDPAARQPGGKDGVAIIVRQKLSRATLMELFPDKFDALPEDATGQGDGDFEQESRTQKFSPATGSQDAASTIDAEAIVVDTMYVRSSKRYPRGKCVIYTKDKELYTGPNPMFPTYKAVQAGEMWPSKKWPVFTFFADTREGNPWGRSRTVDMIPIQKGVNGTFSKAIQHVAIIANAKIVMPKGMDSEWTDEMGQVIRYARTYQPGAVQYLTPPQMPQEYMVIVNTGRELMEQIAGVNAASMGNAPTADPSGRAIQGLQQRDTSRIQPMKASLDNEMAEAMTYGLRLARENMTSGRKIAIVGDDKTIQVKFLDVAALAAGTVVKVFNDQSIPRDPAMRMNFLSQFAQQISAIQDPDIRRLIIKLYRLHDFAGFLTEMNPYEARAERLVYRLISGEPLPQALPMPVPMGMIPPPPPPPGAMPWDHALTFKAVLEDFLSSQDYENRIAAQKADPQFMGASPLEQESVALWLHYTQQAMAAMAPPPMPMPAGASPEGPPSPTGPATSGPSTPAPVATPPQAMAA